MVKDTVLVCRLFPQVHTCSGTSQDFLPLEGIYTVHYARLRAGLDNAAIAAVKNVEFLSSIFRRDSGLYGCENLVIRTGVRHPKVAAVLCDRYRFAAGRKSEGRAESNLE